MVQAALLRRPPEQLARPRSIGVQSHHLAFFRAQALLLADDGQLATGQVDGYFAGHIPDEFFPLLSLYYGVNMLGSILWAVPFGDAEVQLMLDNAAAVYSSYDGFRSSEPKWYCHNR